MSAKTEDPRAMSEIRSVKQQKEAKLQRAKGKERETVIERRVRKGIVKVPLRDR